MDICIVYSFPNKERSKFKSSYFCFTSHMRGPELLVTCMYLCGIPRWHETVLISLAFNFRDFRVIDNFANIYCKYHWNYQVRLKLIPMHDWNSILICDRQKSQYFGQRNWCCLHSDYRVRRDIKTLYFRLIQTNIYIAL